MIICKRIALAVAVEAQNKEAKRIAEAAAAARLRTEEEQAEAARKAAADDAARKADDDRVAAEVCVCVCV
jgi:hypothetical protein